MPQHAMQDAGNTAAAPQHAAPPAVWKAGFAAARDNLAPGLVLWCLGLLIFTAYFWVPGGRAPFDALMRLQKECGEWLKLAVYMFFAAVLPLAFCFSRRALRPPRPWWRAVAFSIGLWAVMGLSVIALYRAQTVVFGAGRDVWTLVKKTAADQFIFTAFYGAPVVAVAHFWRDRGYSFAAVRAEFARKGWFRRMVAPTLVMNWTVWIPALMVIYSLPEDLETHIGGLVTGFWSLLCLRIAARSK